MRIAIIGYSGSGKSTLAQKLGRALSIPVLHLDAVHCLPGWVERVDEDMLALTLPTLEAPGWVIDGNYVRIYYEERMEMADEIIILRLPRIICLWRVLKRFIENRGRVRSSAAEGCIERLNLEFIWWILYKGRRAVVRRRYDGIKKAYPEKTTVIRSIGKLNAYTAKMTQRRPITDNQE